MNTRVFCCALMAVAVLIRPLSAQPGLRDENFLTPLPHGFKIGLSHVQGRLATQEFVPTGETVQNWSEMVTVQIFLGQQSRPAGPFLQNMVMLWSRACPNVLHGPVTSGLVNGYPSSMLLLTCSRDPLTGKPETTLFRAVSGADSFYVAQYAFGHVAAPAEVEKAKAYMTTVTACDTRMPAHSCADVFPKPEKRI